MRSTGHAAAFSLRRARSAASGAAPESGASNRAAAHRPAASSGLCANTATCSKRYPRACAIASNSVSKNQDSSRIRGTISRATRRLTTLNGHCASATGRFSASLNANDKARRQSHLPSPTRRNCPAAMSQRSSATGRTRRLMSSRSAGRQAASMQQNTSPSPWEPRLSALPRPSSATCSAATPGYAPRACAPPRTPRRSSRDPR